MSVVLKARKLILTGSTASTSKSLAHTLLIENGFITPSSKGLYSLLPLGQRVIDKLCRILDVEFQKIGAQKVSMPIIGTKQLWDRTKRWDAMGAEMMTFEDRSKNALCLQPTAEEMCTDLVANLSSLKKSMFPLMLYQINEKFRDEMNPRFGLMRSRQFLMKDMYTFDMDSNSAQKTYSNICRVYDRIFKNILELDVIKVEADSGVHGGQISHEYHLRSNLEEDFVDVCKTCDTFTKSSSCQCEIPNSKKSEFERINTVEVGHTFHLGTKYSKEIGAKFPNSGPLDMCCFGIGVSRLLPAVIDALTISKEAIRLPRAIAPIEAVVIVKKSLMTNVLVEVTTSTATRYLKGGVMLDDRSEISVGKRIRDANRLGIPFIIVLANSTERSMVSGQPLIEVFSTQPKSDEVIPHGTLSLEQFVTFIQNTEANPVLSKFPDFQQASN
ncbi:unnamed protein product [Caenorhabditis angaria]|uniref:proline--tRNA ligase n=1 Tax=Caenorhabditis angaria TaxID=860376 RepID=A0A9P1MWW6_9PELO|nr:unnamed protein product [Caenorhabditis angaria]